jgi:hypothetical protein
MPDLTLEPRPRGQGCSVSGEKVFPGDPVVTFNHAVGLPPMHVRCWIPPPPAPVVFSEAPMPPVRVRRGRPGQRHWTG